MEFMKIGEKSLKITLNAKESKIYGLDENSDINVDDMKGSFSRLLARAKKEVGYKFSGERVVAEIFNAKNGGCEIFLTYAEEELKEKKQRNNTNRSKSNVSIFSIDELSGVINIAYSLIVKGYAGKSSVYYDKEQSKYYIILDDVSVKDAKYSFMGEYARPLRPNSQGYIKEHCKCLCKRDAIRIFSELK
ncbi:MAG: adaptor protein MecA [Clostridia bacterium]|nr:adaptor protein MecA [Clostridia bacterium]